MNTQKKLSLSVLAFSILCAFSVSASAATLVCEQTDKNSIRCGEGSKVGGANSIAIGTNVVSGIGIMGAKDNAISLGYNLNNQGFNSTLVGVSSSIEEGRHNVTVVGSFNQVGNSGTNSTVVGSKNSVNGSNTTMMGQNNTIVSGNNITIIGNDNVMGRGFSQSIAIGNNISVPQPGSGVMQRNDVLIGNDITMSDNIHHLVVIGSGSSAQGWASKRLEMTDYMPDVVYVGDVGDQEIDSWKSADKINNATIKSSTFAGYNTKIGSGAIFSVGAPGSERQIRNVAPGSITKESTDAINGSQLYAVTKVLTETGVTFTDGTNKYTWTPGDDKAATVTFKAGDGLSVATTNDGTVTYSLNATTATGDDNITATATTDETTKGTKINVALNKDITVDSVTTGNAKLDTSGLAVGTTKVDATGMTAGTTKVDTNGVAVGDSTKLTTSGLQVGDKTKVTTDGVQVGDSTKVTTDGLQVGDKTKVTTDGLQAGDVSVKTTGINAGGKVVSHVDKGVADTDAVNMSQLNEVKNDVTANQSDIKVLKDARVTAKGDDNITATATRDETTGSTNINVALNKDLNVNSVTTGDTKVDTTGLAVGSTKVDATGMTAGDTKVDTAGLAVGDSTKVTTDGLQAGKVAVKTTGVDAGGLVVSNVGKGVKDTDAVNVKQLNDVAASIASQATPVTAGTNIKVDDVTKDGKTSKQVSLAPDISLTSVTTGNTKMNTDGITIANGLTLDHNGLTAGQTTVNNTGLTVGTTAVTQDNVKVGDTTVNNAGLTVGTTTVTKDSVKVGDTTVNTSGVSVEGGPSMTKDGGVQVGDVSMTENGINAGSQKITQVKAGEADTDAVNVSQLKDMETRITQSVPSAQQVNNQFNNVNNRIDNLSHDVRENRKEARAGVAGAMAMTAIAPVPYKTVSVGAALANYRDQGALAVGISVKAGESALFKLNTAVDTQNGAGVAAGINFGW